MDGNLSPLTVIPIGSSGFILTGVSGAFALNFVPNNIPSDADAEAQAKDGTRSARQIQHDAYVIWAKVRAKELDAWTPSTSPAVGLGLGCTIGDGISAGRLIKFQDVGFFALTPRNIIFIEGGGGKLLDTDAARLDGVMLIDLLEPSWTAHVRADVVIPPPSESWEIVSASGAVEAYISLRSLSDSQLSIGTQAGPVTGKFFKDILECSVYLLLNSRRVAAGARVWIERLFGLPKRDQFLEGGCNREASQLPPYSEREYHLRGIKLRGRAELENCLTSIARMKPAKTPCSLFSNDVPFPKLDIANSGPSPAPLRHGLRL
jgi:hypothetical protein